MKSRTKIKTQLRRKTSPVLVETIRLSLKNKYWLPLSRLLTINSNALSAVNLREIENNSKVGDTIVVPGKVLSSGNITKKIRVCALSFSANAIQKLKTSKSEAVYLKDEIIKNIKAEGIKIIK